MTSKQRYKLLGVARQYPKMTPSAQQRVQARLKDWESLTPEQREQARKRYQQFKQLPPEKRQELKRKWQLKTQQERALQAPVAPAPLQPVAPEAADPLTR